MARKLPQDKVTDALTDFFDSKSVNTFSLAPAVGSLRDDIQAEIFSFCVQYIAIVAERGLDGMYVNHATMEMNSAIARGMLGDSLN